MRKFLLTLVFILLVFYTKAQNWEITKDPFGTRYFVENLGQFNHYADNKYKNIKFYDFNDKIFFTSDGFIIMYDNYRIEEEEKNGQEIEKIEGKKFFIQMQCLNANKNVDIETINKTDHYFTFGDEGFQEIKAKGYEKIIYKNLYSGIDLEYTFSEKAGIKYKFIVKPNADISQIKMKYNGDFKNISIDNGNVIINTIKGNIIDHKPISFYNNNKNPIKTNFIINNNTISFELPDGYDKSKTLIIDPWVTPATWSSTDVIDIDFDDANNVYIAGENAGSLPYKFTKFDSNGNILWTHSYPLTNLFQAYSEPTLIRATGIAYIGTGLAILPDKPFAYSVDNSGNTIATSPEVDNQGEIWHMLYNNCTETVYGFGGGPQSINNLVTFSDLTLSAIPIAHNFNGYSTVENDIASVVMDDDGSFYSLASSSASNILNNKIQKSEPPYTNVTWDIPSNYNFNELVNFLLPSGYYSAHSNSLALNTEYLYSFSGKQIDAWDKTSGNNLASEIVNSSYGDGMNRFNMGIDVDNCNNVYVGCQYMVNIYNFNGSSFSSVDTRSTPGKVYDVTVNRTSNLLLSCGSNFVQVENAIYCEIPPLEFTTSSDCSNLSVSVDSIIGGIPPYTYSWSTGDTTSSVSGLTNGTYYVTVTDNSCLTQQIGIDTVELSCPSYIVNINSETICQGECTDITATITTQGTPPYTYSWSDASLNGAGPHNLCPTVTTTYTVTVTDANNTISIANGTITVNSLPEPEITGNNICFGQTTDLTTTMSYSNYIWSTLDTSQTITITTAGTYTVTVTDVNGCTNYDDIIIAEYPEPEPSINGYNFCQGLPATIDAGNGYINYLWNTNDTTQTITVSTGGQYSVTITDTNGCQGDTSINIIEYPLPTPIIISNNFCEGSSTTLYTDTEYVYYLWNTTEVTPTITISTGGQYSVTVTDHNGCSAQISTNIIMYSNPNPTITATTPICEGEISTLNAGTYNEYVWNTNDSSQTIQVNAQGNYSVTVTDNNGCIGSDEIDIVVLSNPVPQILGDLFICEGENTILEVSDNYNNYSWTPSGNGQSIIIDSSGTYSVEVTDNYGCIGTASVNVTANPNPQPIITGNLAICNGQSTILDAGTYDSYIWNTNSSSQTITVSNSGNYSVTVYDENACSASTSVNVEVDIVNITTIGNQIICEGEDINLYASVLSGQAPYTYYWSTNQNTSSITVSPQSQTSYQVYVIDTLNCISDTETITVDVSTPVALQINANKDTVCPGDAILITNNITGGIPPYTLTDQNNYIIPTNYFIYPNTTETYYFIATDACNSTANDNITIYTYPIPSLGFSADILKGCTPLTVHFNLNQFNNNSEYIWNFDNINENNLSLATNPYHTFTNPGYYDISVQATNIYGCKNQLTIENMIQVFPNPKAKFDVLPDVVTIIDPTFDFDNYSENAFSYIWNFDDGDTSNLFEPSHTYNDVGEYLVELIAISAQGCKDTAEHLVRVEEIYTLYAPSAFSPDGDGINDEFFVVGTGIDLDNFMLIIYNRWGEVIWQSNDLYEHWNGYAKDGNEKVQNGTYVWKVIYKDFKDISHTKSGMVTLIR